MLIPNASPYPTISGKASLEISFPKPWGFKGSRHAPLNGGAAAKRVRVVSRGAIAPDLPERINGCRESEISLASGQPVIRFNGVDGLNAQVAPLARGMQRESASVSLAKWCCLTRRVRTNVVCLTTHILRSAINRFFETKPSFATVC